MADSDILERLKMSVASTAEIANTQAKTLALLHTSLLTFVQELLEENTRLRRANAGLTGPHGMDPEECPTFHDGCHCTVENLVHNIERAEAAEAKLEEAWTGLVAAVSKAFLVGDVGSPMIKERHITAVMETLTKATT